MTTVELQRKDRLRQTCLLKDESLSAHCDIGEVDRGTLSPSVQDVKSGKREMSLKNSETSFQFTKIGRKTLASVVAIIFFI